MLVAFFLMVTSLSLPHCQMGQQGRPVSQRQTSLKVSIPVGVFQSDSLLVRWVKVSFGLCEGFLVQDALLYFGHKVALQHLFTCLTCSWPEKASSGVARARGLGSTAELGEDTPAGTGHLSGTLESQRT